MVKFKCNYNGLELEGQYSVNSEKREMVVELILPYSGLTIHHCVVRRDFEEYMSKNVNQIAERELISIYNYVNLVEAHYDSYSNYQMEYDRLCSDKLKFCDDIQKVLDDSLATIRSDKHTVITSTNEKYSTDDLMSMEGLRTRTLREVNEIDQNLQKKYLSDVGKEGVMSHTLLISILEYLKESGSKLNESRK